MKTLLISLSLILLTASGFAKDNKPAAVSPTNLVQKQADSLTTSCVSKEAAKSASFDVSDRNCQCSCGQWTCNGCIFCPLIQGGPVKSRIGKEGLTLKEVLR